MISLRFGLAREGTAVGSMLGTGVGMGVWVAAGAGSMLGTGDGSGIWVATGAAFGGLVDVAVGCFSMGAEDSGDRVGLSEEIFAC